MAAQDNRQIAADYEASSWNDNIRNYGCNFVVVMPITDARNLRRNI